MLVYIDQSGDASTFFGLGDINIADVAQSGTNSSIDVIQTATNPGGLALFTPNVVALSQDATDSSIYVEQIGEGNDVGELGAPVTQIGTNLAMVVRQDGRENGAFGSQSGMDNILNIDQNGFRNEVNFDQAGFLNVGEVTQDGRRNFVELTQAEGWNEAVIHQDGNDNDAFVNQTIGNTQLAVENQIGNGNTVNVSQ